ncbi:MAG: hypothetical protein K0S14_2650, partial [Thermomicrobiales bacterium]|nr:hypothetical protein [Thermomicrobiales bacterium]
VVCQITEDHSLDARLDRLLCWGKDTGDITVDHILKGDLPGAAALYVESLQQSQALQFWAIVVSSLLGLAGVAVAAGQPEVGARLLGATEGFSARLGGTLFIRDDPVHDRVLTTLRQALSEDRLALVGKAGQALSIESAIAEAETVAEAVLLSR